MKFASVVRNQANCHDESMIGDDKHIWKAKHKSTNCQQYGKLLGMY